MGRFLDVPEDHTHHDDIEWLAAEGITKGTNPPENTKFSPDDPVTRGQMATFLRRFAKKFDPDPDPDPDPEPEPEPEPEPSSNFDWNSWS